MTQSVIGSEREVITSENKSRWDFYFNSLPQELQDINFSFDYHYLYENIPGELKLFIYREGKNIFYYPFFQKKVNTNSAGENLFDIETVYGYTGPLSTSRDSDFIKNAEINFSAFCSKENIVTEFIRFNPLMGNQEDFNDIDNLSLIPLRDYVIVDLSIDDILDSYHIHHKREIIKAQTAGVKIVLENSEHNYSVFKDLYLGRMREFNASKIYFFNDLFFERLYNFIRNYGIIVTAYINNEAVGSSLFIKGARVGYFFLSGGNKTGRMFSAGYLTLHHGILWGKENGLEIMHLGGGITQSDEDPLLVFKKKFSSLIEKFYIGKRIHNKILFDNLISEWENKFPQHSSSYNSILQRYRLEEEDMK